MTTSYRAVVERGGEGWRIRLDGPIGAQDLAARDLADVESRCRRRIEECHGDSAAHLDVQIFVPTATQVRLELIAGLCEDIAEEWDAAHQELLALGVSRIDAARLLRDHYLPPQLLTVPSRELAVEGLEAHPDAVGVEWSDHGHFVTVKCRHHVEATRHEYKDADPGDECALIYDPKQLRCDLCMEGGEGERRRGEGNAAGGVNGGATMR